MKTSDLLLLGIAGVAIYYFFFKKNGTPDDFGGGGGGGGGGGNGDTTVTPPPSTTTFYYREGGTSRGRVIGTTNVREVHAAAGSRQRWTGASFGQPGQPSVAFANKTLAQAAAITGNRPQNRMTVNRERTVFAAAAIRSGAPPRVVAKIKAGKWY